MNENIGRSSYAPADVQIWGGYGIPSYWNNISDLMTKQIFAACAKEAKTVRQMQLMRQLIILCSKMLILTVQRIFL